MRYKLSKLIPVPMRSTYGFGPFTGLPAGVTASSTRQTSTWWQWRDRILRHRITAA